MRRRPLAPLRGPGHHASEQAQHAGRALLGRFCRGDSFACSAERVRVGTAAARADVIQQRAAAAARTGGGCAGVPSCYSSSRGASGLMSLSQNNDLVARSLPLLPHARNKSSPPQAAWRHLGSKTEAQKARSNRAFRCDDSSWHSTLHHVLKPLPSPCLSHPPVHRAHLHRQPLQRHSPC